MNFHEMQQNLMHGREVGPLAPSLVVMVGPNEFSDEWARKPRSPVAVGIRLLACEEDSVGRKMAAKKAQRTFPDDLTAMVEEFETELRAWAVARCICDPNDAKKPHPSFPLAEDTIRSALTGAAIIRLFDVLERHQVDTSPLFPEATDDELIALAGLLADPSKLAGMSEAREARARRYAHFVLDEILEDAPQETDTGQLLDSLPDE